MPSEKEKNTKSEEKASWWTFLRDTHSWKYIYHRIRIYLQVMNTVRYMYLPFGEKDSAVFLYEWMRNIS